MDFSIIPEFFFERVRSENMICRGRRDVNVICKEVDLKSYLSISYSEQCTNSVEKESNANRSEESANVSLYGEKESHPARG